jgi:hypothetical protein
MGMDIQQKLEGLEKQIQDTYAKHTVIDDVCTPIPVEPTIRTGQFRQIANNILMERERIIDPNNYLLLAEIGASVARGEIEYLVRNLTRKCLNRKIDSVTYDKIAQAVEDIKNNGFTPNHIFMPIEYSHDVLNWNRTKLGSDWRKVSILNTIYINESIIMKVTFSNKYMPFEEIVITSKKSNKWEYRPAADRSNRLTAKFDWDYKDPVNTLLSIKTIFNHIVDVRGNLVITPMRSQNLLREVSS